MPQKTVSIRGGRERVDLIEDGSGPDLLYLHGLWGLRPGDPLLDALTKTHHVIAPRLPGLGESTGDDDIVDLFGLLYYLLDLLDELRVRDATVVAHSLGGLIAPELLAMQPDRFNKLVLIAPFGLWNDAYPNEDIFTFKDKPEELKTRVFHDPEHAAAVEMFTPTVAPEDSTRVLVEQAKIYQTSAKYLWPIPDRGLRKRAHRVLAPTLIAWGRHDHVSPVEYAEDFKGLLPNATVQILEQSGHYPQIEEAEALASAVSGFLDG